MTKKHLLEQIGHKIEKNKVVKMINNKLGAINQFIDKKLQSKEGMEINMKNWSVKKRWSPFERSIIKMTG